MPSYSDVHDVLMAGDECSDCEYRDNSNDIRECLLIVNGGDPAFCPGAVENTDTFDLEDDGTISVVPKLSAYDE